MSESRRVYTTEGGRLCPGCGKPEAACECRQRDARQVKGDGRVRVSRETKGRKGKGVTLVTGLPLAADELKALGKRLKQFCGTGGTVREGVIELQGDQRDALVEELNRLGYQARKSGG